MAAKFYANFGLWLYAGGSSGQSPIDYLSDTIKVLLTTSTYTPSQTSPTAVLADVTIGGGEVSGTGYTTGGATLGTKTAGVASLVTTIDAADSVWTSASFTARYAVVYDDTLSSPSKPLISHEDFGGNQTVTGADFTLQWAGTGIGTITVA